MARIEAFAPAKVNLALHVTGRRTDGYHTLDSYVAFADIGDRIFVEPASEMSLSVTGPFAIDVPADPSNLCWKAADRFGEPVAITLDKQLPAAAGVGGGSSDAAAVIRALEQLTGRPVQFDPIVLGADVPVCMVAHAAHMQGIGEAILPLHMAPIAAVLVNPRVPVSTPAVFAALENPRNPAMTPWPESGGTATALRWLKEQRNDLQGPAIALHPEISDVLAQMRALPGCRLARMSGSGATCFALFDKPVEARRAAEDLMHGHEDWWIAACNLA